MSDFIGRGENETKKILQALFPKATISAQVPIEKLINPIDFEQLDEEFQKHKCDLVLYNGPNIIVIEVNYKHKEKAAKKWTIFEKLLKKAERIPITINDYNCEYLFSDSARLKKKMPWGSHYDIIRELNRQGITPNGTMQSM